MAEFNWLDHVIAFFVLVFFPLMSLRTTQSQKLIKDNDGESSLDDMSFVLPPKTELYYHNGFVLIIGSLIVLTSWNISSRSWANLGIQWPNVTQLVMMLSGILIVIYLSEVIFGALNRDYLRKKTSDLSYILPSNLNEYSHYIFMAFAAGICEEIVFRGFLIRYLDNFFAAFPTPYIWAIILPAISFALSHSYQGGWAVLKILVIAVLLGFIFYFSESLLIVIILHIMVDLISGYMGIIANPKTKEEEDT